MSFQLRKVFGVRAVRKPSRAPKSFRSTSQPWICVRKRVVDSYDICVEPYMDSTQNVIHAESRRPCARLCNATQAFKLLEPLGRASLGSPSTAVPGGG